MHILITNDDGPPSQQSSPYIHSFVENLQKAGHEVSIVLPDTQKSWIGKAHLVGHTLKPTYFQPGPLHTDEGRVFNRPSSNGSADWVLVNGTPASCVQVGLHHFFQDKGAIDLVISGPNYGRNTTALFTLSSGTIGGALEGAVCGKRAIALSYAFDSRNHDPEIIKEASQTSVKLIEHLYKNWPDNSEIDIYNINVPLRQGVSNTKILYTDVLNNRWSNGSSYDEIIMDDEDADEHEYEIREKDIRNATSEPSRSEQSKANVVHRHFKWAPKFKDVYDSVEKAGEGNDGYTVKEGMISVTPLRANFWHVAGFKGEIKLSDQDTISGYHPGTRPKISARIDYPDSSVQPLLLKAVEKHLSAFSLEFPSSTAPSQLNESSVLQVTSYETLDFEHALSHPSTSLLNAYVIRKALIRKHYLSNTVASWIVKNPESILKKHFKPTIDFELDYAEFLDDALLEAYELHETFENNATKGDDEKDWWILKPGMSDGGNGIRLFSSFDELQAIFEEWETTSEEEDSGHQDEQQKPGAIQNDDLPEDEENIGTMTSQLRHFIAQPYITSPLLLPSKNSRKFHVRVYALAVGSLKVYVYREMLALFAAKSYIPPAKPGGAIDLASQLTNTCFQDERTKDESVFRFWSLEDESIPLLDWKDRIWEQICLVTGEVFQAAARGQMIHFQTLPNAFELFGVDFLVDESFNAWLLELNAFPDFKQTGQELQEAVVGGLFDETVRVAVRPFFEEQRGPLADISAASRMTLVLDIDLGRR